MLMEPQQPLQPGYSPPTVQIDQSKFTPKQKRLIVIVSVLFGLFVFVMILSAIFSGKSSPTELSLTAVSARNSEVLRLVTEFEDNLTSSESKTFAIQTKALVTSDNLKIINYTKQNFGSTHTPQQIANTEIQSVITNLSTRTASADFNEVFVSSVQYELNLNLRLLEQIKADAPEGSFLNEITQASINNLASLVN